MSLKRNILNGSHPFSTLERDYTIAGFGGCKRAIVVFATHLWSRISMTKASTLLEIMGAKPQPAKLSDSVVIIVDAQREYLDGAVPLANVENALVEIKKLLSRARSLNVPIFHVVHHTQPGAPIFAPDSATSQIIDAVRPEGTERVISKSLPSAFVNTDLAKYLQSTDRKEVVVAGFMTHMCINATTRSAVDLGFTPTVLGSACATRDLPGADGSVIPARIVHESNLASLADLIACVANSIDDLR
jgi:nicotinamidase-related amidase